jgi:HEAT repeat protein
MQLRTELTDDVLRHRLALAVQCLPELSGVARTAHADLVNHITTTAFTLWWEHLLKGAEDVVPHLTRVLPALGQVNGHMAGVPLLEWLYQRLCDEPDSTISSAAARSLTALEVAVEPSRLQTILDNLRDGDEDSRLWAINTFLVNLGPRTTRAAVISALLQQALDDLGENIDMSADVVGALGRQGESAARDHMVVSVLLQTLRHHPDDLTRLIAGYTIGNLASTGAEFADFSTVVAVLCELISSGDQGIRAREGATYALGWLGEQAAYHNSAVVPILCTAVRENSFVGYLALDGLYRLVKAGLREPAMVSALRSVLPAAEWGSRLRAATCLEHMAAARAWEPSSVASLCERLSHPDPLQRGEAAWALGLERESAAYPSEVIPPLCRIYSDPDPFVRWATVRALRLLAARGVWNDAGIATLRRALHDSDMIVRCQAIAAFGFLAQAGAPRPAVIPALCATFCSSEPQVRQETVFTLGALAATGMRQWHWALDATLWAALGDSEASVRAEAVQALAKMAPTGIRFFCRAVMRGKVSVGRSTGQTLIRRLLERAKFIGQWVQALQDSAGMWEWSRVWATARRLLGKAAVIRMESRNLGA